MPLSSAPKKANTIFFSGLIPLAAKAFATANCKATPEALSKAPGNISPLLPK